MDNLLIESLCPLLWTSLEVDESAFLDTCSAHVAAVELTRKTICNLSNEGKRESDRKEGRKGGNGFATYHISTYTGWRCLCPKSENTIPMINDSVSLLLLLHVSLSLSPSLFGNLRQLPPAKYVSCGEGFRARNVLQICFKPQSHVATLRCGHSPACPW